MCQKKRSKIIFSGITELSAGSESSNNAQNGGEQAELLATA